MLKAISATVILGLAFTSCDQGGKKGKPLGAPAIKPPVDNNMPSGFKSSALGLSEGESPLFIDAVKDYFYPTNGFVGPIERLGMLDLRMASLNIRAEETEKQCTTEVAADYDIGASLPGGDIFAQKYQCQETLGGEGYPEIKNQILAFGLDENLLYLNEHRYDTDGSAIIVLVQAAKDASSSEVWDVRWNETAARGDILHIKGDDVNGGVEVTSAGTDTTGGSGPLTCGIHAKSNSEYMYFKGRQAMPDGCQDEVVFCLDAKTLSSSDLSLCTAAKLDDFSMTSLTPEMMTESVENLKAIAAKEISGYTGFNEDVPEDT